MQELGAKGDSGLFPESVEGKFSIKEAQWVALKRLADRIRPQESGKRLISTVSLSMFIAAIVALFPLYNLTMRMGSWVLHTAWICLTLAMILGILLIVVDSRQESAIELAVDALRAEMNAIENAGRESVEDKNNG